MIIEYRSRTYRVEPTGYALKPHAVWVEIPRVDFTGRTRTHWRRLSEGPTQRLVAYFYELEKAKRAAEMFESAEVGERPAEKTIDRLEPRHRKWRTA